MPIGKPLPLLQKARMAVFSIRRNDVELLGAALPQPRRFTNLFSPHFLGRFLAGNAPHI